MLSLRGIDYKKNMIYLAKHLNLECMKHPVIKNILNSYKKKSNQKEYSHPPLNLFNNKLHCNNNKYKVNCNFPRKKKVLRNYSLMMKSDP